MLLSSTVLTFINGLPVTPDIAIFMLVSAYSDEHTSQMINVINSLNISPVYQNSKVSIRPYTDKDVKGMFQCISASITEMQPYLPWVHEKYNKKEAKKWVAAAQMVWHSGRQYDFVIVDHKQHFVGGVGLLNVDPLLANACLGYWIGTPYTGKGYAMAASQLVMAFARQLKLRYLTIYMATCNKGSIAVAEKLGAQYQTTRERYETVGNQCYDCKFYRLNL